MFSNLVINQNILLLKYVQTKKKSGNLMGSCRDEDSGCLLGLREPHNFFGWTKCKDQKSKLFSK